MDLWIRSQDKMAMSKYDLLIVEETPTGEYMFIADHYKNFGTYQTKARVLEILDEIQNILTPPQIMVQPYKKEQREMLGNNSILLCSNATNDFTINQFSSYVYEMPKE